MELSHLTMILIDEDDLSELVDVCSEYLKQEDVQNVISWQLCLPCTKPVFHSTESTTL